MADTKISALPTAAPLVVTDDVPIARGTSTNHKASIQQIADLANERSRVAGSTYSTTQHLQDIFHSSGVTTGGTITDDADGTITVSLGTGLIRATNSSVAELLYFDWAAEAGANVALTDNDMNYVYVEYNAGSPQVIATITKRTEEQTNVFLGSVYRSGTTLHITETTCNLVNDAILHLSTRLRETQPFAHVSGGIISETGTRNLAITAGDWWENLANFTTSSTDTSAAGTFSYFYDDGASGWTTVASSTQIDNTQYDDGSGSLATLDNNKYGVHWVYLGQDSEVYVIYGTTNDTLIVAKNTGTPSNLPPHFAEAHARLVGRIIIGKSDSAFTEIASAFDTVFTIGTAVDHGDLIGLADDDHPQYAKLASDNIYNGNREVNKSNPVEWIQDTSGTSNEEVWHNMYQTGQFTRRIYNDARGSFALLDSIDRTGFASGLYNSYMSSVFQGTVRLTRTLRQDKGADVASASALPLLDDGNFADVTGVATITSMDTLGQGTYYTLQFDGELKLTHHATDLILPGGRDIYTVAGDTHTFFEYATGDWILVNSSTGRVAPSKTKADVSTAYVPVLTDGGRYITCTNAAAITCIIPAEASVDFPIDTEIFFEQGGAGAITFSVGGADTLDYNTTTLTLVSGGENAVVGIKKTASGRWIIFGDLVPA